MWSKDGIRMKKNIGKTLNKDSETVSCTKIIWDPTDKELFTIWINKSFYQAKLIQEVTLNILIVVLRNHSMISQLKSKDLIIIAHLIKKLAFFAWAPLPKANLSHLTAPKQSRRTTSPSLSRRPLAELVVGSEIVIIILYLTIDFVKALIRRYPSRSSCLVQASRCPMQSCIITLDLFFITLCSRLLLWSSFPTISGLILSWR